MNSYNPSVDLTIFPRINFLATFEPRAYQRDANGRIFLKFGFTDIDDEFLYPPASGSDQLVDLLPFPVDLGPLATTIPTGLYDLREDNNTPQTYDLIPLN
mgnify:CR=1 FL=1